MTRQACPRLATTLLAIFLATACGSEEGTGPAQGPEVPAGAVYIHPLFFEAFDQQYCCAQIGDNGGSALDWDLEGTTQDRNGERAQAGDTVVLHLQSPYYERLDTDLVVPDNVTPSPVSGLRMWSPHISVYRIVPAIARAKWSADLAGPTIELDIYSPHGLQGTRVTYSWTYFVACLDSDPFCEIHVTSTAFGPVWQPDPSVTGTREWIQFQGSWTSWPDAPPPGYGGPSRVWATTLNLGIEDDDGHAGSFSCSGGRVPSSEIELSCYGLFQK